MPIIKNNIEALCKPCSDVNLNEVGSLVDALEKELEYSGKIGSPGIGLAAPQIGLYKNIAIVRIDKLYSVNLVNCKITKCYDKALFKDEGCLSFPGMIETTERYQEILVEDNLVHPHKFIATGLLAVVIQHELDHLKGILLPDIAIKKVTNIGDNEKCLCGSGLKYKQCCKRKKI